MLITFGLANMVSAIFSDPAQNAARRGELIRMSNGHYPFKSSRLKQEFRDRHEWRSYRRAVEIAKEIVDKPELISNGASYLERFVRDDPTQERSYRLWLRLLRRPPQQIAGLMVRDTPLGERLRETAPVFVTISQHRLREIWRERR